MVSVQTLQVRIICDPEAQDALSERLFEAGAGGVEERPHELVVYTDSADQAALFAKTARQFQKYLRENMPDWQIEDIEICPLSSNWQRLWHEALDTVQLTERFKISTLKKGELGRSRAGNELFYRPESSFGSGSHPTTRLIAQGLETFIEEHGADHTIFDVGTGNGVLCLLALALGVQEITACDVSEIALESTRHNLQLNGYSERVASPLSRQTPASKRLRGVDLILGSADCTLEKFQVVLANIEAYILTDIAPHLVERLLPHGSLHLSGILVEQRESVVSCFRSLGLTLQSEAELDGWLRLEFKN